MPVSPDIDLGPVTTVCFTILCFRLDSLIFNPQVHILGLTEPGKNALTIFLKFINSYEMDKISNFQLLTFVQRRHLKCIF